MNHKKNRITEDFGFGGDIFQSIGLHLKTQSVYVWGTEISDVKAKVS